MSSLFRFPGAFVWQYKLPNHGELKTRVLPKIIEEAEANSSNPDYKWSLSEPSSLVTNYGPSSSNPFEIFTAEDIRHIALGSAQAMFDSEETGWATFAPTYIIKGFWWNRYTQGSTAPPHAHSAGIAGVYLLEQAERCPLEFMDLNAHSPDHENQTTYHWPEAEEGTVLLFPGSLTHWVRPTVGPRTTVSFNLSRAPD